ncbi:hypothetical protein M2404_003852 [Rheinheimera pacifica]|uniref:hypothetical protein n=1 Tax=Rheinheimera pacifica TaxID=173990 RepID=UPI002167087F|nr:hypothetical protein [Rheinheimera pacifica]MCS4309480.1 hypothetical protein [Rheinheimera pacifica]
MNTLIVMKNLVLLLPISIILWFLVLSNARYRLLPRFVYIPFLLIITVPLGGYLGAAVAAAFGENLDLAPFSWVEQPLFAAQVIGTCFLVGGSSSYGLSCFAARMLSKLGVKNLPPQLVGKS